MLGRLIKASAVVIGVGLVTGCAVSPVKLGAAAIVGDQRITIATLGTQVTNLNQTAKQYPGIVQLSATQATQQTLTWLIRYQINEELARQAGITISPAQAQAALNQIFQSAKASAQSQGLTDITLGLILAANGIPPDTSAELARYQAVEIQFVKNVSGGTLPTSTPAQTAAGVKFQQAQCQAAKALNIAVNPQFGRLDYIQYQVVSAPAAVSRPQGPATAPSLSGLAPAC